MGKAIEEIAVQRGHTIILKIDETNLSDFNSNNIQNADIAIEFTGPHSALDNIKKAIGFGTAVVSGSTGWTEHLSEVESEVNQKKWCLSLCQQFQCGSKYFF